MTLSLAPLAHARSEQDLVAATRSGDDRAFEELYARYRDRIASFIHSKVHDHARAEDIAQDVFISALRRLRANDQEITFKPWIYEIAKNACIDEFRRTKRTREVSLEAGEELGGDRRALLSVAPTPSAAVESKQSLNDLQGAFGVLSESHHRLLVMREFEGLSYSEIGARTGMSRQVVESTLFRARRKLTEEYDEIASGRRCEQVQALIAEGRAQSARACGIRQRRQLTRHLAYCQACRRKARLAGVDESFVKPRSVIGKIAALLPFPMLRWPFGGRRSAKVAAAHSGSRHLAPLGSAKTATAAGSAAPSITLGQAGLTAAALVAAGVGGGVVTGAWSGKQANRPTAGARAASRVSPAASTVASSPHRIRVVPASVAGGTARVARQAKGRSAALRPLPRAGRHGKSSTPKQAPRTAATNTPAKTPGGGPGTGNSRTGAGRSTVSSVTGTARSTITGTTKSTVSGVRTMVKRTTGEGSRTLSTVGGTTQKVTSAAGSTVQKVTSAAGSTVSKVGSTAGSTVSKAGSAAGSTVSKVGSTAGSTVSKAGSAAGSAVGGATGGAGPAASGAGSAVSGAGSAVGGATQKVTSGAGGTVTKVGSTAGGALGKVGSTTVVTP